MSDRFADQASAMFAANRMRNRTVALLIIAGAVVALLVSCLLTVSASSFSEPAYCGKQEHSHEAGCYSSVLSCGYVEDAGALVAHAHAESCYVQESVLVCGYDEVSLASETSEEGDAGGSDGMEGEASSISTDSDALADGVQKGESEGADLVDSKASDNGSDDVSHTHTGECYKTESVLMCGLEEGQLIPADSHQHDDTCYAREIVCDEDEHVHNLACYSNPNADVETAADWEATLPEADGLTGIWADDLIAVAESQLGYAESTENYEVLDDGAVKGYTRYGAWYGDAYGDWCAMFVSFCLNYAGIPVESMPREGNCHNWIELLSSESYQMYYPVGSYADAAADALSAANGEGTETGSEVGFRPEGALSYFDPSEPFEPVPGDIVFFDWDADNVSDHVGIVAEAIAATEMEPAKLRAIEGNAADMVKYCEYELDDKTIMGYAALPIKPVEDSVVIEEDEQAAPLGDEAAAGYALGSTEGSLDGVIMWDVAGKKYQKSWHKIGSAGVVGFTLVPSEEYSSTWQPNVEEWTIGANANYLVAYCGDRNTSSSSSGVEYNTCVINKSRYSDAAQYRLSAIVSHAYPFISAADMKAEMSAAGVTGVENAGESELLAATQWAIWATTNPDSSLGEGSYNGDPGEGSYINPIESTYHSQEGRGCSCSARLAAIKDYLLNTVTYTAPLEVSGWEKDLSIDESDGLTDLTVTVILNRAIEDADDLSALLSVSDELFSNEVDYSDDKTSFAMSLSNLTAEQVEAAQVSVSITGSHIQAYAFDSDGYQDFVSGNKERYSRSAVMAVNDIGSDEGVSVSVSKMWEDLDPAAEFVQVALLADGSQQDVATLSSANDWTYTWTNLPAESDGGAPVSYTVEEITQIDGYRSSVVPGRLVWEKISDDEEIVSGEQYLMVSASGALAWTSTDTNATVDGSAMEWVRAGKDSVMGAPERSRWIIEQSGSAGSYTVKNAKSNQYLYLYKSGGAAKYFTLGSNEKTISLDQGYVFSGSSYFRNLSTGKVGELTSDKLSALKFDLYRPVVSASSEDGREISFTIVNTKESSLADISLKKVSSDDGSKILPGAVFDLYKVDSVYGSPLPNMGLGDKVLKVASGLTTGDGGVVELNDLVLGGTYYLVERVAPEGYNLLTEPVSFMVGGTASSPQVVIQSSSSGDKHAYVSPSSKSMLVVMNEAGYVLPETGGEGVGPLLAVGAVLIFVAGGGFMLRSRGSRNFKKSC